MSDNSLVHRLELVFAKWLDCHNPTAKKAIAACFAAPESRSTSRPDSSTAGTTAETDAEAAEQRTGQQQSGAL